MYVCGGMDADTLPVAPARGPAGSLLGQWLRSRVLSHTTLPFSALPSTHALLPFPFDLVHRSRSVATRRLESDRPGLIGVQARFRLCLTHSFRHAAPAEQRRDAVLSQLSASSCSLTWFDGRGFSLPCHTTEADDANGVSRSFRPRRLSPSQSQPPACQTLALPMRFNFPNDPRAEEILSREELADVAIFHYLRTSLFDRREYSRRAPSVCGVSCPSTHRSECLVSTGCEKNPRLRLPHLLAAGARHTIRP